MHGNYGMERVPDMSGLFHAFKNTLWFKTTTWGRLYIHSWVFSMYNSLTSSYCTCMSFLVASRQFFGKPILCDDGHSGVGSDHLSVKDEVLKSYCWMYAHFQIPKEYIGPCSGKDQESIEGPIYNSYYQWIPIYLMFLAILFYLPRMLWMVMEGNDSN